MILRISCVIIAILLTGACTRGSVPSASDATLSEDPAKPESNIEAGSCSPLLETTESDEDAIRQVLNGEGTFVVSQDIEALMNLWASGSLIADAKNTPNNKDDDQVWKDKDAIRHRYVRTVFPGAPSEVKPSNLNISLNGVEAVVIATTNIGDEISPHGDEWRLVNENGCWLIKSLTYNLEEK